MKIRHSISFAHFGKQYHSSSRNNKIPRIALPLLLFVASTIKTECLRTLNILKFFSHPTNGCNRQVLLPLYQSLIPSILDYASSIYDLALQPHLKLLGPIQNSAVWISSALSLCTDTGILPLSCWRLTLTTKIDFSLVSFKLPKSQFISVYRKYHPYNNQTITFERALNSHLLFRSFKFQSLTPVISVTSLKPFQTLTHQKSFVSLLGFPSLQYPLELPHTFSSKIVSPLKILLCVLQMALKLKIERRTPIQ